MKKTKKTSSAVKKTNKWYDSVLIYKLLPWLFIAIFIMAITSYLFYCFFPKYPIFSALGNLFIAFITGRQLITPESTSNEKKICVSLLFVAVILCTLILIIFNAVNNDAGGSSNSSDTLKNTQHDYINDGSNMRNHSAILSDTHNSPINTSGGHIAVSSIISGNDLIKAENNSTVITGNNNNITVNSVLHFVHPDAPSTTYNVAFRYYNKDDNVKALEYFSKALEDQQKLSPQGLDTASIWNSVGLLNYLLGHYTKAKECFYYALVIYEESYADQETKIASVYNNLAINEREYGNYDESLEFFRKLLFIQKKSLNENNSQIIVTHNNIAKVYANQGKFSCCSEARW